MQSVQQIFTLILTFAYSSLTYSYFNTQCRCRMSNKGIHAAYTHEEDAKLYDKISSLYDGASRSPHSVIELSLTDHKRIIQNSIHLSGLQMVKCPDHNHNLASYHHVRVGSNLKLKPVPKVGSEKQKSHSIIQLHTTKYRYVAITASKEDVSQSLPGTLLVHSSGYKSCQQSGVVILLFVKL